MGVIDVLFGRPLASSEGEQQRIGPAAGISTFGLDALSSAAYGPEAALTVLLPLGAAGLAYIMPLSLAVVGLLAIVYFSYRQTIAAYPGGGGSYTVAKENLGERAGLLAASALMIDYLLNVAVGISAGVGALVSAAPALQPYTLWLCLLILFILMMVNLRGTREAGLVFMLPTYVFVVCLLGAIAWGLYSTAIAGGSRQPVAPPPQLKGAAGAVSLWLLLKAFASGCTALTGVEAVSNGVQAFREPVVPNARKTLTAIIAILILMLAGIAYLARAYRIGATPPGAAGYQSVLSQLTGAVAGRGVFYYVTMSSILLVLSLSANTSFAGFPQLCRTVAANGYMPRSFANRGRRLVYSEGIYTLTALAGVLLIVFGGVTDRLIPLFAVGAFLAFTLSQAGMVAHWKRNPQRGAAMSMLVNGLGAVATGITVAVVLVAKFVDGAWVVVLLIPALLALMTAVQRHYQRVERETKPKPEFLGARLSPPLVIVPVEEWSSVAQKAVRFALTLSREVQIVHVDTGERDGHEVWLDQLKSAAERAAGAAPEVIVVHSPYRLVIQPIIDHVLGVEKRNKDRTVAVVIPELVERRWYHYFLHNQRGELLSA